MNALIEKIIDVLYSLFGDRFKGYRTLIVAIISAIIGAYELFSEQIVGYTCEHFKMLCDWEGSKAAGKAIIVMSALMYILRKMSDTPSGKMGAQFLRRFTPKYREDVQALRMQGVYKPPKA